MAETQKIETKKAKPIVYAIYNYLCDHCVGHKNRTYKEKLASVFGITTVRLREILTQINMWAEFDKIVCRRGGIYIADKPEDSLAYIKTARNKGLSFLYEAWQCENKHRRAGQGKIAFGDYFKAFCETYEQRGTTE